MRSETTGLQSFRYHLSRQFTPILPLTFMRYWLLFWVGLLLSAGARAQTCGAGDQVSIKIVHPDGRPVWKLTYKLTRLERSEDLYPRLALAAPTGGGTYNVYKQGVPISPANVEHLRPLFRSGRKLTMLSSATNNYQLTPIPKRGRVQNGLLTFYSKGEGIWEPCLLRLTDGQTVFYLACNPFGDCYRTTTIYWGDSPRLVLTQQD